MLYYASLASFYTIHDLRNLKADQTRLYLLCYAWVRYRQLTDNLVDAMAFHMKQLEYKTSAGAKQSFAAEQVRRHLETPKVGRLLSLYVDDSVADPTPFGEVRQRAYKIMSKDVLQSTAQRISVKPLNKLALHWQAVDGCADRVRRHLRPLYVALDFTGPVPGSRWLAALAWATGVFAKQQRLSQRPLAECPAATLPKRLRPYLLLASMPMASRLACTQTATNSGCTAKSGSASSRANFTSTTVCSTGISPTNWFRWPKKPSCSLRWTSRSCGSQSMPSSIPWRPSCTRSGWLSTAS